MNILVLAPQPFYQNRGTPIATLRMLHILSEQGHMLDLLTYHEGEPIDVHNCRHVRIPKLPWVRNVPPGFSIRKLVCDLIMTFYVLRMCWRRQYDVIHAVEESVFMAMMIGAWRGIPYIYDMDSSLPRQLEDRFPFLRLVSPVLRWFEGHAVRNSQGVVAVCESLEQVAAAHSKQVPIVRVEDASLLMVDEARRSTESERMLGNIPGRVVMYVGNLEHYQGIDLLLDSFVHVFHYHSDVHLVIVGGCEQHIDQYRLRAQKIGIATRTHFLGPHPVEQLGEFLRQADVLVSPRVLGNNTPMKVFSFLESGKPVLATRLGMHTQVLDDDVSVLVGPNPLDMARGMCALLDDYQLCTRITSCARQRMRQRFSVEILDAKLSMFYQDLTLTLGCQTC
jgi:glycosyltransferase involved in cell wall biosynthesis